MTADAKVGLLLGLFFIIVIAFLINGLPKFLQAASNEEQIMTQIEVPTGPDLVIDNPVVEAARDMESEVPLRRTTPPEQVVVLGDPSASRPGITPEQIAPVSVEVPNIPMTVQPETTVAGQQRYHVVQRGESLAAIAKKYYGPEQGNRRIVIQKLYESNRDVLKSPDKVCVNDKLVIPSLGQLLGESSRILTASAADEQPSLLQRFSNFFEPVESDTPANNTANTPTKGYIVQQGESLWSIAQKTLGDGKRYKEILELNSQIKDPDDVRAGMNLKIPQS